MEPTNDQNEIPKEEQKTEETKPASKVNIPIIILLLFIFSSVIYLYLKTFSTPADVSESQVTAVQQPANIAALENAVKTNPSYDNWINLSVAYINNQMPQDGLNCAKKAIELNPKSAIAYNNMGVAYNMMQQYQNGIDACTKALQLDTAFQLAKNNLKWAMDEKRKVLEKIQKQEQAPATNKDVPFYIELGMNYYKINNFDKSIEVWSKVFDIDKKNVIALNNIGTSFMMKLQYDDAITLYKKALELEPTNQLAKNNLAWALDEKNRAESNRKN